MLTCAIISLISPTYDDIYHESRSICFDMQVISVRCPSFLSVVSWSSPSWVGQFLMYACSASWRDYHVAQPGLGWLNLGRGILPEVSSLTVVGVQVPGVAIASEGREFFECLFMISMKEPIWIIRCKYRLQNLIQDWEILIFVILGDNDFLGKHNKGLGCMCTRMGDCTKTCS